MKLTPYASPKVARFDFTIAEMQKLVSAIDATMIARKDFEHHILFLDVPKTEWDVETKEFVKLHDHIQSKLDFLKALQE